MRTFGYCECGSVAHYQYKTKSRVVNLCIGCGVDIVRAYGSIAKWLTLQNEDRAIHHRSIVWITRQRRQHKFIRRTP